MLAAFPSNALMDPLRHGNRYSDSASIEREYRSQHPATPHTGTPNPSHRHHRHHQQPTPPPQQQQLPSFREIVPPALHSAIDSTGEVSTKHPAALDPGTQPATSTNRTANSALSSPRFSQTGSMPDSLDELGHRNYESVSYPQSRSNSTWSSSTNYINDMATSYQRQSFYGQSFGPQKQFSSLPPMREAPADGMYNPTGAYSMYNGSPQAPAHVENPFGRRPSGYTGPLSSTYPGADRSYPSLDAGFKPSYGHNYQQPRHSTSFFPETYGSSYGSMPGNMSYQPMNDDGRHKKRRGNLPKHTTDLLRSWLQQHIDHPYPTEEEKQYLMSQTGLNLNQISNWFINARRRHWPAMKKEAQGVKNEK